MSYHTSHSTYDVIVIGSGFGGSMIAHTLVNTGLRVLMLERGDWVKRSEDNWAIGGTLDLTPYYTTETPYRVLAGGDKEVMGICSCVGGPSVFYGCVSIRFREADFKTDPDIVGNSGARWPYSYSDLEPYYTRAEQILNVAGEIGHDPTEPYRSSPYPQAASDLSDTSRMIEKGACDLGLNPFRLPLAINYNTTNRRTRCISCTTCDSFACAVEAKNDLATCVLPQLIQKGLDLKVNTAVTQLEVDGNRIHAVSCYDKQSNQRRRYYAKLVILSAGTLASPHLLLASDLTRLNSGGEAIGRYLMRHCNAIVFGIFPQDPNKAKQFHKQLGIHDFYFGHPTVETPVGKLGGIQQLQTPPVGLVQTALPKPFGQLLSPAVKHLTGLLVMAEDQPQYSNGVEIDHAGKKDRFGLPQLNVTHRYTKRDAAACNALIKVSKRVLSRSGAWLFYVHRIKTFSHAVGTVRMGEDPETSALDAFCQFRGIDNLYVVDGSFMPTSAGLNPSLTIAANALRVGEHIARKFSF